MSDGDGTNLDPSPGNTGDAGGGGDTPVFLESLNEEVRGNEALSGIESADALATKYIENVGSQEELRSQIPKVPEKAEEYAYEFGADAKVNEEAVTEFKGVAHKLKMSAEQFKGMMDYDAARSKATRESHQKLADDTKAELVKDMGDDYAPNLKLAQKVLKAFGAEALMNDVELGNSTVLFKALVKMGKTISEDKLEAPGGGGGGGEKDAASVLFGDVTN